MNDVLCPYKYIYIYIYIYISGKTNGREFERKLHDDGIPLKFKTNNKSDNKEIIKSVNGLTYSYRPGLLWTKLKASS